MLLKDKSAIIDKMLEEKTTRKWCADTLVQIFEATPDIMEQNMMDKILWAVRWAYIGGYKEALVHCELVFSDESEPEEVSFPGTGLHIVTVTGMEFDVHGPITYKDFPVDGRIYYCAGQSWPEEIVAAILTDTTKTAVTSA